MYIAAIHVVMHYQIVHYNLVLQNVSHVDSIVQVVYSLVMQGLRQALLHRKDSLDASVQSSYKGNTSAVVYIT
jgi:hypothetical protein